MSWLVSFSEIWHKLVIYPEVPNLHAEKEILSSIEE
jgi:hypothetical protein